MSKKTPEQKRRVALRHEGWAHGHVRPLDLRSGDTIVVLAGRDKGRRGKVERVLVDAQRIVVSGVNVLKRHTRAGAQGNVQGGIVDFDAPIAYSNVMLVCPRCDKPTRVKRAVAEDGTRSQVCGRCGENVERVRA